MESNARDAGYDDFLDAVRDGDAYYLECANGHGSVPPRRACPRCGSRDLTESPLAEPGHILTHSTVHVATPQLTDDAPYTTAVAEFGAVRLTGFLRGLDGTEPTVGLETTVHVETTETTGRRALVFRPANRE